MDSPSESRETSTSVVPLLPFSETDSTGTLGDAQGYKKLMHLQLLQRCLDQRV